MAQEYFPFDAGTGAAVTETQWRRMARLFAETGVETGLTVSIGTGTNVNVAAGSCWVDGHYYRTDATVAVPFSPNTLATPITVRVVARLDPTANTIALATTTAALTQNAGGTYEFLLAEFTLPASGTAQTPTNLTDRRCFAGRQSFTETQSVSITGTSGSTTFDLVGQIELPVGRDVRVEWDCLYTNAQFTNGNTAQSTLHVSYDNGGSYSPIALAGWSAPMPDYATNATGRAVGRIPARSTPTRCRFRVSMSAKAGGSAGVTRIDSETVTLTPLGV